MKKGLILTAAVIAFAATGAMAGEGGNKAAGNGGCVAALKAHCEECHYPARICARLGRTSERKWRSIIGRMIRHGAKVDKKTARRLARCLAELEPGSEFCR